MTEQDLADSASGARGSQLLALLTQRRGKLVAQIRRALAERQEEAQTRDAPGSHGWGAAPEGNLNLAMVQQQEGLLAQIDAAIRRHKAGTYGVCLGCGEQIPLARLKALPFAQRCAQCQEDWEEQTGHPPRG
ncbi:MAG TPA: TraR/DksA family transcriptional regulator [Candidatus Methylomirabilis sp.]|nr:TraR/DksA family transcriptional regulator [Candidatus Methylomirabilis sp.]